MIDAMISTLTELYAQYGRESSAQFTIKLFQSGPLCQKKIFRFAASYIWRYGFVLGASCPSMNIHGKPKAGSDTD